MTADPVEFLTRVLAEVEERAKAAPSRGDSWSVLAQSFQWGLEREAVVLDGGKPILKTHLEYGAGAADHIAYWDPAMVLRQVAGARKVLELHGRDDYSCKVCLSSAWGPDGEYMEHFPCSTLKIEAERWGWTE